MDLSLQWVRRIVVGGAAAVLLAAGLPAVTTSSAAAAATCSGSAPSDFNGDGISDVAIGEQSSNGEVHILYGTRSGLHADATSGTPNDQILKATEAGTGFGGAVVALDLNGDHCADLAVGMRHAPVTMTSPGGTPQTLDDAGVVEVFFGWPKGLSTTHPRTFVSAAIQDGAEFGTSLAAGNFNGDSDQDLVVGSPAANHQDGSVDVILGAADAATNAQPIEKNFVQGADGVPARQDTVDDFFGQVLAVGDFNGDHVDDLAIGAPDTSRGGEVVVMTGSGGANLFVDTNQNPGQVWREDNLGIAATADPDDNFGSAVAVGDFNGDHHADLAVGVSRRTIGTAANAGMVDVIYGTAAGLAISSRNQSWSQNSPGISGTAEEFDDFGRALAAGDFDGNGKTDLAIGVPGEGIGSISDTGVVSVLMGGTAGLSSTGQQTWDQGTPGIAGTSESGDEFGLGLAVGRTHSSARDDLIVGVPDEGIGSLTDAGEIQMIAGSGHGLVATGSQAFSANTAGVQGTSTRFADFGSAIS